MGRTYMPGLKIVADRFPSARGARCGLFHQCVRLWGGRLYPARRDSREPGGLAIRDHHDRLGRTRTASAIMLISAGFSLGFGWLIRLRPIVLVLGGLLYSFFVVAGTPGLSAGLTELAPPHSLGSAMGFQTLIGFLAASASPAIFGRVLDWTNVTLPGGQGSMPAAWGWAFGMLGLGVLAGPGALTIVRTLPASAHMAGGKR